MNLQTELTLRLAQFVTELTLRLAQFVNSKEDNKDIIKEKGRQGTRNADQTLTVRGEHADRIVGSSRW